MGKETQGVKNGHFCSTCHKVIGGSEFKFKCHKFSHREVKPRYTCDYCLKEFYRNDSFRVHLGSHIKKTSNPYAMKNPYSHFKHTEIKNKCVGKRQGKKYPCKVCCISYCEYRLLVRHIRQKHFNYNSKEQLHETKLLNETWIEKVKNRNIYVEMTKLSNNTIVIKRCKQIKNESHDIKNKQTILSNNLTVADDKICDAKNVMSENSKSIRNVRRRDWIESMKLFSTDDRNYSRAICTYCKKEMLKKSLINHIKEKHFKIRQFKCETCNCYFNRRYQLTHHICGQYKPKSSKKTSLK